MKELKRIMYQKMYFSEFQYISVQVCQSALQIYSSFPQILFDEDLMLAKLLTFTFTCQPFNFPDEKTNIYFIL